MDWIVRALHALGWQPQRGERVHVERLAEQLRIAPRFHRLLPRLVEILVEAGRLARVGAELEVVAWPTAPATIVLAAGSVGDDFRFKIAHNCAQVLADILAGRIDPLDRLFPNGSSKLASDLYNTTPEAEAYNRLLAEAVAKFAANAPVGRKIRILEVGGGTGGTTSWLLPEIAARGVDYMFTDISPALVERAKDRFGAYEGMSFSTLDLEVDAQVAGIEPGSFDVVVAANVVHATADLRRTLSKLRTQLAPGGALFMLEVTGFERWIDLSFGLTEGWWRFTDADLRPDYPLLDRGEWLDVLASCGYEAAEIGPELETSSEALLVARRPLEDRSALHCAIAGGGALAGQLADALRRNGHRASVLDPEHEPTAEASFDALVYLGYIAPGRAGAGTGAEEVESVRERIAPLLRMIGRAGAVSSAARIWIVTQGATSATGGDAVDPVQATAVGFRRSLAMEHAEWRPAVVDLSPAEPAYVQVETLAALIVASPEDDEIALRGESRFVSRLARVDTTREVAPFHLVSSSSGVLDDLAIEPCERRAPGPGQVGIRVRACGLNFRDVLNALAMRDDGEPLGGECAGLVTALGPGVTEFAVGDAVVATAVGAMASHVIVDRRWVASRPAGLTEAQAAALPLATMTAHHALREIARLSAGQVVLIHAGAGGVGLAAIGIARGIGARIFATAGSEHKRALLREMGVEQVFSSRTLGFEAQIATLTGGRGVDIVLNSLAGDFIGASVRCLAETGAFLEIGKQGIWSPAQFATVRPGARYHVIDLSVTRQVDPGAWGSLFRSVVADVARGDCNIPLVQVFPIAESARAFAFMAQARHIGKVVLEDETAPTPGLTALDPSGSYLVTGGLTGLGLRPPAISSSAAHAISCLRGAGKREPRRPI